MKAKYYIYVLTDFWGEKSFDVATESADLICVWGKDKNGNHQQFESEAYHLFEWAKERGFTMLRIEKETEI